MFKSSTFYEKLVFYFINSLTAFFLIRYTIFSSTLKWGTWSYGENLISYPSKFLRRGLLGEIILFFSGDSPAFNTIQSIIFVNCLVLMILIYVLFKTFKLRLYQYNIFLLSSFSLLYLIYYGNSFNRKEIFAINFFLIFLYYFQKNNYFLSFNLKVFLFSSLIFTSLIHEGLLLITLPFYYLILKTNYKKISNTYFATGVLLFLFLLTQQGSSADVELMWNELSDFDRNILGNNLENSAIYALAYSYERQIFTQSGFEMFYKGTLNHWIFILFYFYLYIFINHFGSKFKNLSGLESYFFKKEMLFCIPLFLFGGADWGRYFLFFVYLYYFYILFEFSRNNIDMNQSSPSNFVYVFLIYSFFTIIPEATYQDLNIFDKFNNSFDELLKLIF
tara:strand:- start:58391 stop:59560 length:1170 start_codon:yes stop_codon:yes gene_type:complete